MRNGLFGILSTAASGFSNLIVQLAIAGLTTVEEFGQFAVTSTTVILILGLSRAVIGQTDMLRGGRNADAGPAGAAYLMALWLCVIGLTVVVFGFATSVSLVTTIGIAVALSSIFVLQDSARFRCFRLQKAGAAFASDLAVVVFALGGLYVANRLDIVGVSGIWIWAGATLIGFVVVSLPIKYFPRRVVGRVWLVANRDLVVPSVGEYALQSGVPYLLNWMILALGGFEALAGYRLIQLLFGAVLNLAQGVNAVTLPRVVNSGDPRSARVTLRREGVVIALSGSVVFASLLLIPEDLGVAMFNATWNALGAFLIVGSLHGLLNALSVPNFSMLRLLGFATYSFYVRAWSVVVMLVLVLVGAYFLGAVGVAWGMAIAAGFAYWVRDYKVRTELATLIRSGDSIRQRGARDSEDRDA